jgi:MFS family permease
MKLLIKSKHFSSVLGAFAAVFGFAFLLPLNNFSVYITSYINLKYEYITMHYGLFINLIFMFANTFSNSLGGYLENIIGFFPTIIVGFSIIFVANFIFIFQQNIWLCFFLSMILGIGAGVANSLFGKNIMLYVPDKKGLYSGILGFGVMIITAIFALSGEKIINFEGYTLKEDEQLYPEYIAKNTYIYFLIGEIFIPIGLIFTLLLTYEYNPEENQQEIKSQQENSPSESKKEKLVNTQDNQTPELTDEEKELKKVNSKKKVKQVIKTFRYWKISLISFLINIAISFMVNTGRTFGAIIGINGNALQFAGILQVLFVLILGPILGILVDKKGGLIILRIVSISCILPSILMTFFMENDFIFIMCFIIYVLDITGMMVSFGPFIMEVYGIQESVILGGIMNGLSKFGDVITTVAAFAFSLVCETKNEEGKDISDKTCLKQKYAIMYFISGICCCISSLLLFFEKKDKFIYDDDDAHNPNKETPTIEEKNNQSELNPIIAEQDK